MSVYLRRGRGWMYDFVLKGERYTSNYFKTKAETKRAEATRREELKNPVADREEKIPTGMAFLELVNKRLDHVKAHCSERHYREHYYLARRWTKRWRNRTCDQISREDIEAFMYMRGKVSKRTANKELRYLRATFNLGIKRGWIKDNPTNGISFMPEERRIKRAPEPWEIDRVIAVADREEKDYLICIRDTLARVSEINRLTWDDVDLSEKTVTLYTRKKKGGHLTPRKVPMTLELANILTRRFSDRDRKKAWVFWHRYWSRKQGKWVEGPYQDRKKLMEKLCAKAGVAYFRFHGLRHSGASVLDVNNVPLSVIQRILGHENRSTTEIYLHSIGQPEREAVAVLEQVRKKSQPKSQPNQKNRLRLVT